MTFVKGEITNPRGRPKMDESLKEKFKDYSHEAAAYLYKTMHDEDAPHNVRVKCAEVIMDRAWGKAAQPIEGGLDIDLRHTLAERLTEALARVDDPDRATVN